MKWYTCTPVSFKGDHTFFSRDSGAFCKAFQRIGVESRAIMPTPAQEGDDPDLIRTEYANLKDAAWWKSLGIDGVILSPGEWANTFPSPEPSMTRESFW